MSTHNRPLQRTRRKQRAAEGRRWASQRRGNIKSHAMSGVLSLLPLLLLSACASSLSPLEDVSLPPERLALKGYSLLPPDEKGWQIMRRTRSPIHVMLLNHRSENQDETLVIEASSNRIPENSQFNEETLQLIREANARRLKASPRYKRLKGELALSRPQGMDCIRSYTLDEDYEAAPVKASGKSGYMIIELVYISCFHPRDRLTGIRIDYSQRYYPNHQDPNFLDKANAIFNTIEVTNP